MTPYDELHQAGSLKEAKLKHLQRLEGKEYIVKDGDVVYFRARSNGRGQPDLRVRQRTVGVRSKVPGTSGESRLGNASRLARHRASARVAVP